MVDEVDKQFAKFGLIGLLQANGMGELEAIEPYRRAHAAYTGFSDKNPNSAYVYERLAQVYEGQGDNDLAVDARRNRDRIIYQVYGGNYNPDQDPLVQAEQELGIGRPGSFAGSARNKA
ncbi:MAG: hypothetical protein HY831_03460 [Candidatus Aenigmarchaeota archaeon]|nr:hypothetical protein [Candidatus Aenigmarchaeota archaeon]